MLAIDAATVLLQDLEEAAALAGTALAEERSDAVGADVIASAALRAQQYDIAIEILGGHDDTPFVALTRNSAIAAGRRGDERKRALKCLEDLSARDDEIGEAAALSRLLQCIKEPHATDWSDEAAARLESSSHRQFVVSMKAIWLARTGRDDEAESALKPFASEPWALEARFHVTLASQNHQRQAEVARRVLERGADPGLRLQCALALSQAGDAQRAKAEVVAVGTDRTAPKSLRGDAYHFLVSEMLKGGDAAPEMMGRLQEWVAMAPRDERHSALFVPIARRLAAP
jgi:hypothetical protein